MKTDEVALVAVYLAAGMVAGFVIWTYVGPMLAGHPASPAA
jgi:hypothetical protein